MASQGFRSPADFLKEFFGNPKCKRQSGFYKKGGALKLGTVGRSRQQSVMSESPLAALPNLFSSSGNTPRDSAMMAEKRRMLSPKANKIGILAIGIAW
jgi:hypothetical protein